MAVSTKASLLYVVAFILLVASIQASWFNDETESTSLQDDSASVEFDEPAVKPLMTCSTACKGSNRLFNYQIDRSYEYAYEGNVKTTVPNAIKEHSSLHIKATVSVDVLSQCDMRLRLSDLSIMDSNPTSYEQRTQIPNLNTIKKSLQSASLRFSFDDGQIDSVCPGSKDEPWVVNILKAIASSFQNNMNAQQSVTFVDETDIHGTCPSRYEVTSSATWSSTLKVKRSKDLVSCVGRNSANSILQGVPYLSKSKVQSVPILKSTQNCEQEIDTKNKWMTKSTCTESHVFKPMANEQESGATTDVDYTITFVKISNIQQIVENLGSERITLKYDHSVSTSNPETVNLVKATLSKVCDALTVNDQAETFSTLLKQLKNLDEKSMSMLTRDVKQMCPKAQAQWMDSLPLVQTASSIRVIKNLLKTRQIPPTTMEMFFNSFAFIRNPTSDIIAEIKSFLSTDYEKSSLGISSLINTFCGLNDCSNNNDVKIMMKMFEDDLKYNCKSENTDQEMRMLRSLKAIGNAGNSDRISNTLTLCASNTEAPMRLRIAALEAFRRLDCVGASRENLLALLENNKMDSELRIQAYLQSMVCADRSTIERVKRLLENEEVNQVGSFIWTHLTNLRESESPMKNQLNEILSDVTLKKTFDLDARKFSRNIEFSTFSDLLNTGATLESNIILSQKSFVPRSANLNVTVDLFGNQVNLFELSGRAEGLEETLERYARMWKEEQNNDVNKRQKRAVVRDDAISVIDRKYETKVDKASLIYSVKVLGNELEFSDLMKYDNNKEKFNPLQMLIQMAKDQKVEYTRSYQLIDTSLNFPTGLGLPLKLNLEVTSVVNIQGQGKIDIRQMFSNPSNFDISGTLNPSASLVAVAEMGIDSVIAKAGLKLTNKMTSSSRLDGKLQLKDGKVFNFDIATPQDKIEIFNAESHFYVTYRTEEREQISSSPKSQYTYSECTGDDTTAVIGLNFCAELSYPSAGGDKPVMLFTEPAFIKIYATKTDSGMKSIHFDWSLVSQGPTDKFRISYNTPGSQVDREVTFELTLNKAEMKLQSNLKSPWAKVKVDGALTNTDALRRVYLGAVLNEKDTYSFTAELKTQAKPPLTTQYSPRVVLAIAGRPDITFDGIVNYIKGRKMEFKMALKNVQTTPITFDGNMQMAERISKYNATMKLISKSLKVGFSGSLANLQDAGDSWATRADITYQYLNNPKEQILFNHKVRDMSTKNLKSYSMDCSFSSTAMSGDFGTELAYSSNSLRTKLTMGFDDYQRFTIIQSASFDVQSAERKVNGRVKIDVPFKNVNYELMLNHLDSSDQIQTNGTLRLSEDRVASFDLGLKTEKTRFMKVVGELKVRSPTGHQLTVDTNVVEKVPREYVNILAVQIVTPGWSGDMSAQTVYNMAAKHEVTSTIYLPGYNPITFNGHLNPNPKNLLIKAEVVYNNQFYTIDGKLIHRGTNWVTFNTASSLDVRYPGREHGIKVDVSRKNADFTINGEVKLARDDKIAITSQISASQYQPKAQIRIEWPGDSFVAMMATGKYETKGWLSTTNDVEAAVKFTSSFRNFEELQASMRYDHAAQFTKLSTEIGWAPTQVIATEFTLEKSKLTINASTPFNGFESLKSVTTYTLRNKLATANSKVQWGDNQATFFLHADANNLPSVNAKIALTSTIRGFESFVANLKHQMTNGKMNTNAELSWARNQQISVVIGTTYEISDRSSSVNGDMTIKTPFRGLQLSNIKWRHTQDPDQLECHYEATVYSQKYALDMKMQKTLNRQMKKIYGNIELTTPFDAARTMTAEFDTMFELNAIRGQIRTSASLNDKTIGIDNTLDIVPNQSMTLKSLVTTPFDGYEKMGLDMDNRMTSQRSFSASNELSLAYLGKISVSGSGSFEKDQQELVVRVTTPCQGHERVALMFRNLKKEDNSWDSKVSVEVNSDSYTAESRLNFAGRQKRFDIDFDTPIEQFQKVKFVSTFSGVWTNFQVTSELQHNLLDQKIRLTAAADTRDKKSSTINLNFASPFEQLSVLKINGKYMTDANGRITAIGSYEVNKYTGNLRSVTTGKNWSDVTMKNELTYLGNKKINLDLDFKTTKDITVNLLFKSPIEYLPFLSNKFNLKDDMISNEIKYGNQQRPQTIMAKADWASSGDDYSFNARLTTPFTQVERLVFHLSNTGPWNSNKAEISGELNDKKITATHSLRLTDTELELNRMLETPFDAVRRLGFSLTHTGPYTDFANSLTFKYNEQEISVGSNYKAQGPTAQITLRTPYDEVHNLIINFVHTPKSENKWTNVITITHNGNKIASSDIDFSPATLKAKGSMKLEKEYTYNLVSNTDNQGASNINLVLKMGRERISTKITVASARPTLIDIKALVETTFKGYEKFETNFGFKGTDKDFKLTTLLTTPIRGYNKFNLELTHSGDYRDFSTNLNFEHPDEEYSPFQVSLKHKKSRDQITDTLNLNMGSNMIKASFLGDMSKRPMSRFDANIITSYPGYEKFSGAFEMLPQTDNSLYYSAEINTSIQDYETFNATLSHSCTGANFIRSRLSLNSNSRVVPSVDVTYSQDFNQRDSSLNSRLNIILPAGPIEVSYVQDPVSHKHFKGVASLMTPYSGYDKFEASTEYDAKSTNKNEEFVLQVNVATSLRNWETTRLVYESDTQKQSSDVKYELTTSYPGYEKMNYEAKMKFDDDMLFYEYKWSSTIPYYEKERVLIDHKGKSWENFKTVIEMESSVKGFERFASTVQASTARQVTKASATLEHPYMKRGEKITANVQYIPTKKTAKILSSVETPYRGYEKFSLNFDHQMPSSDSLKTVVTFNTPIRGYQQFSAFLTHSGSSHNDFRTDVKIITPIESMPKILIGLKHKHYLLRQLDSSLLIEYADKKIESEIKFEHPSPTEYSMTAWANLPCPVVRNVRIVSSHSRSSQGTLGTFEFTYNDAKKVDFDYSIKTDGEKNIVFAMRSPFTSESSINVGDKNAVAVISWEDANNQNNWDKTGPKRQIQFEFGFKNIDTRSKTDRGIEFKTTLPSQRVVGLSVEYQLEGPKFNHQASVTWDNAPDATIEYTVEASRQSTRSGLQTKGRLVVKSPALNFNTAFTHNKSIQRCTTNVVMETDSGKRSFSFDTTLTDNGFKNEASLMSPYLSREIKLTTEGTLTSTVAILKTNLKWEGDQSVRIELKATSDEVRDGTSTLFAKFVHPYSGTDVEFTADLTEETYDRTVLNAGLDWKMTKTGETKTFAISGSLNERTYEITSGIRLPWKTLSFSTVNREFDEDRMVLRYDVIFKNEDSVAQLSTDLSVPDRMINAKLSYDQAAIQVYGQIESPTKMSIDLNRFEDGAKVNEANVGISVDEENMISGRLYYNPNIGESLKSVWNKPGMRRDFETKLMAYRMFAQTFSNDLDDKQKKFDESFAPITAAIRTKIDDVIRTYMTMYRNNVFYIRDIHRFLEQAFAGISEEIEKAMRVINNCMERCGRKIAEALQELSYRMVELSATIQQDLERLASKMSEYGIDMEFVADLKIKMHREVMRIRKLIEEDQTLREIVDTMKQMTDPAEFKRTVYQYVDKLTELSRHPQLREALNNLVVKIKENSWMYSFLGVEQEINELLDTLGRLDVREITGKIAQYLEETFKFSKYGWKVWDPRKAEYVFQAYLPVNLNDYNFNFAYLVELFDYLEDWIDALMAMIPEEDWNLVDTLYAYKPPSDIEDIFPPFKSHATLVGSQHYTTFDKKSYEFAGECSYLLTRDFIGKTFAVIVNYEKTNARPGQIKKSINVMIDKKQVEIFSDARITLDGARTELPISFGNTSVVRHGNQIILSNQVVGLGVKYHLTQDICTVGVSGWNFGKLAGLLGTYDNEPYNDMMTVDGNQVDKAALFADSWTIGQKCRPTNKATDLPIEPETRKYKICASLFKETSSPFRSCFSVVDPAAYLQMCINDMPTDSNKMETTEDTCRIASAYVQDCKSHEVHIRVPRECVKCDSPMSDAKYFYENERLSLSSQDQTVAKIADVVFVVEHAPCNKDALDKLKTVMDDLNRAMLQEGISSARYAVVGYGGKDSMEEPHSITMEGQIFNTANKVFVAPFATQSGSSNDTFSAIRYAARLPYRAGASKNIILLSCNTCTEKSMRYTDVQRILLQHDIRFHHLIQDSIKMKASAAKTTFIFGFDEQTVYTRKDVASEDLSGEADLRKYIRLPKDYCSALTQDTDGSIFSVRQWLDSRVAIQKRFSDVLVRIIARKAKPTECQLCHCNADENNEGASHCTPCEARRPTYSYAPDFQEEVEEEVSVATVAPTRRNDSRPDFVTGMPKPLTPRPPKRPVTRKPKPQKPAKPVVRPVRPAPKPVTKKAGKFAAFFF